MFARWVEDEHGADPGHWGAKNWNMFLVTRAAMEKTMDNAKTEQRLDTLEATVADLKRRLDATGDEPRTKDWRRTFGMSANDPEFDAMIEAGKAYRKSQRWEDEPDAGAGH